MNKTTERTLETTARKLDVLLWLLSVPLIPMIIAEFTGELVSETKAYFEIYYFAVWALFVMEFAARLTLAKDKVEYLKSNWIDVLVVLTPAFRVFKVFRFMQLPVVLLSDRALAVLSFFGMNFLYYLGFIIIVVLVGADLGLYFERQYPGGGDIHSFGEALWWAFNAITTSGAAGIHPVSTGAKTVATLLMTLGFALFGILVASLASLFVKERAESPNPSELLKGIGDQIGVDDILERLERIEKKLDRK